MPLPLIVTLITTLANTLLTILTGQGVVSSPLAQLINTLVASGASLFGIFKSGGTPSTQLQAVLTALQADLKAVQADTTLDPKVLAQIVEAIAVVEAAIAAFEAAQAKTDPSTLTPIPPIQ
jgi:hypothetical protein